MLLGTLRRARSLLRRGRSVPVREEIVVTHPVLGRRVHESAEIRGTIDIRQTGGLVVVGPDSLIEGQLVVETPSGRLTIGANTYVGGGTMIASACEINIGDDVLISYWCLIMDSDNHSLRRSQRRGDLQTWRHGHHDWSKSRMAKVTIGDGAWIGARSTIVKGVTLGEGAIVAAGSVVSRDVPAYTIVAGNPAAIVRELDADER